MKRLVAVLRESHQDFAWFKSDAQVGICAHGTRQGIGRYLDARLKLLRETPEEALKLMEAECLDGLAYLQAHGPEHSKRTGRTAGGGTLVKGS